MTEDIAHLTGDVHQAESGAIEIEYYTLIRETKQIQMCPGDVYVIYNVLYDYTRPLNQRVETASEIPVSTRYFYTYHAQRCQRIQRLIGAAMDHSTEDSLQKCRKKQEKRAAGDVG